MNLIITSSVEHSERKQFENWENINFPNKKSAIDFFKEQNKQISVYELTDFMDLCNNQDFDIENSWVGYINIKTK